MPDDRDNVVRLVDKPTTAEEQRRAVGEVLGQIVERFNRGEIEQIAIAFTRPDGTTGTTFSSQVHAAALRGAVCYLGHRMDDAVHRR